MSDLDKNKTSHQVVLSLPLHSRSMPAPLHGGEMLFTPATVYISLVCPFNRLANVRPYVSTQIPPTAGTLLKARAWGVT